jgi:hypothetical protein
MTVEQLQSVVPLIAVAFIALAFLLLLMSLRYFRKSRTDFYWRRRRAAGQRGWRLFVWSVTLTLVSGILCMLTGLAGLIYARPTLTVVVEANTATNSPSSPAPPSVTDAPVAAATLTTTLTSGATLVPTTTLPVPSVVTPAPPSITNTLPQTPTQTLTPTTSRSPTMTLSPTLTPTSSASPTLTPSLVPSDTLMPTASPTPTITWTPSATLVAVPVVTQALESSVTPGADASLRITGLDTQVSSEGSPIKPATTFKAGFNRIFFFLSFSGMQAGVLWRRELVFDDKVIQRHEYLWGMAQDGTAFFFFGQEDGFKPGKYEIRLFIGEAEAPAASASFTVT